MTSLKTNFNLRSSNTPTKKSKVYLVCRWNNQRLVYPTDVSIIPNEWDLVKQLPTTKNAIYSETKQRLTDIKNIAENEFRKFVNDSDDNYLPSKDELKGLLYLKINGVVIQPKEQEGLTFFQLVEKLIEERKTGINPRSGKNYSIGSYNEVRILRDKLNEFIKSRRIKAFGFENITLNFYYDFMKFLKGKNYSTNYIGKMVKVVKMVMNEGLERKLHANLDFKLKRFVKSTEETPQIYLTQKELSHLERLDLSLNKRLDGVRDLLILGAWTGLRFSDFTKIRKNDINLNAKDGKGYILKKTAKTGETVQIPILEPVIRLLNKYRGLTPNGLPVAISNQRFNDYVKELGQIAGLDEPIETAVTKGGMVVTKSIPKYQALSSHVCRRSFATNLFEMGVPTLTIRAITGHKTETAFLRYIRVTPKGHADEISRIVNLRMNPFKKVG
jgi:integrase